MKTRYRKLLACELYIKETKKHWWSPWKIDVYGGVIPIAYRRVKGKFVRETDYILRKDEFMSKFIDEWVIREVIDTLYMARTALLGITGLDSPQEVAQKSANETAITRRISNSIDLIQQSKTN